MYTKHRGTRKYEGSKELVNVLVVYSDKRLAYCDADTVSYYTADILVATDYSPFGVSMKQWYAGGDTGAYRFGFNGQEKDDEVYGTGNEYDFGARIYDSRLGRWLSVDPLYMKYPNLSPYVFGSNNPTYFLDKDGRDIVPTAEFKNSPYYSFYLDLTANNSGYKAILTVFNTTKFKYSLHYTNQLESKGSANAETTYPDGKRGKEVITRFNPDAFKLVNKTWEKDGYIYTRGYSDFNMVRILIHEAVHAQIRIADFTPDQSHTKYNERRQLIVDALTEYNEENKLGYTAEQINEFSYQGTLYSEQFIAYLTTKAAENKTTVEEERAAYNSRMEEMIYKTTVTKKPAEEPSDTSK